MRVVHTIASLEAAKGGPSRTVPRLCQELAAQTRWQPEIITTAGDPAAIGVPLHVAQGQDFWRRIGERLAATGKGAVVLHDHGVWLGTNAAAIMRARVSGVPVVISPRGMLEPWALGHGRVKKRIAMAVYQRRLLHTARGFHATSYDESDNLRRLGLRQPIAVIPNGVDIPAVRAAHAGGERVALFLSRLNVKKGLLPLLDAWERVRPVGWRLVIAGPDEDGYGAVVAATVMRLGLNREVTLLPEVADAEKWTLYRSASLFVLPSFSENFGVVVAEALASGVPAVTTTGMPWQGVIGHDCGWRTEPTIDGLAATLQAATGVDDAHRAAMGDRGRTWMNDAFSWGAIGRQMGQFYDWLITGNASGGAPDFVDTLR